MPSREIWCYQGIGSMRARSEVAVSKWRSGVPPPAAASFIQLPVSTRVGMMREPDLEVEVDGDLIVVSELAAQFIATQGRLRPQLILRKRTESDDYELFARPGRLPMIRGASLE